MCSYVLCILYPVLWSYALYVSSVVFILCALCILACYLLLYDVYIVHFCVLVTPVLWYLCSGTRSVLSSLYSALRSLLLALLRSALSTLYSALYSPLFTPLCALYSTLHSPLRSAFRTLYSVVDSALYLSCVLIILECCAFSVMHLCIFYDVFVYSLCRVRAFSVLYLCICCAVFVLFCAVALYFL